LVTVRYFRPAAFNHHHHHHFICSIIQQYAHLHEYDSRRAGQQGPIRTLTAALKRSIKTKSLGAYSITQIKILRTRKTRQINLFNAIPKTFKDAKFVVDGNALQTFITLSRKNFCLMLAVHLGLMRRMSVAIKWTCCTRQGCWFISLPYVAFANLRCTNVLNNNNDNDVLPINHHRTV